MNLRIARKICKYMGHGYPINDVGKLKTAVRIWERACKRIKHFKRNVKMNKRKDWRRK